MCSDQLINFIIYSQVYPPEIRSFNVDKHCFDHDFKDLYQEPGNFDEIEEF